MYLYNKFLREAFMNKVIKTIQIILVVVMIALFALMAYFFIMSKKENTTMLDQYNKLFKISVQQEEITNEMTPVNEINSALANKFIMAYNQVQTDPTLKLSNNTKVFLNSSKDLLIKDDKIAMLLKQNNLENEIIGVLDLQLEDISKKQDAMFSAYKAVIEVKNQEFAKENPMQEIDTSKFANYEEEVESIKKQMGSVQEKIDELNKKYDEAKKKIDDFQMTEDAFKDQKPQDPNFGDKSKFEGFDDSYADFNKKFEEFSNSMPNFGMPNQAPSQGFNFPNN